jgi:hypothetical protein
MHARPIPIVSTFLVASGILVLLLVAPAAAATCRLSAPAKVAIGTPLSIVGSGFPASSSVDVSLTIEGGSPDEFTAQSDASGAFQISLTPEAADAGKTTVVATAGAGCTAQVVFTVGTSNAAPTPEPTEAPAGAGTEANPPKSDAAATVPAPTTGTPFAAWLVAVAVLAIGLGGLIATRPVRSR